MSDPSTSPSRTGISFGSQARSGPTPTSGQALRAYAREAAGRAGLDPDLFERQIQQESGFDPDAFNDASGATGVAQLVPRFHPDVDPHDPRASLEYAAR